MVEPPLPELPHEPTRLLRTVQDGEVLGASRQLHVLGECLVALVSARTGDVMRLSADVRAIDDYVRRTRGASSQAVTNGLALMARPALAVESSPDEEVGERLLAAVAAFRAELSGWQLAARYHAAELLDECRTILMYDYSSSVSQAVAELSRSGRPLQVFVPEARSLDGGRKYLADWHGLDILVDLVPDSAVGWALDRCDVALVGAETLSAEGGCYNTIGTAIAAHEANLRQVPFHVLSILLKTHLDTSGAERPIPMLDFLSLPHPAGRPQGPPRMTLRGSFADLDYTAPAAITSIVTEHGCLDPAEVAAAARAVLHDSEPARD